MNDQHWLGALLSVMAACSAGRSSSSGGLATTHHAATTAVTRPSMTETLVPTSVAETSGCVLGADPDPGCTPGALEPGAHVGPLRSAVDPGDPLDICAKGYTATIRPPVSVTDHLKAVVGRRYAVTDSLSNYEGDHLVSLELGGAPEGDPAKPDDVSNFWDEPHAVAGPDGKPAGSAEKDKFENALRREVCLGQIPLAQAQHEIAVNWYQNWVAAGRPTS